VRIGSWFRLGLDCDSPDFDGPGLDGLRFDRTQTAGLGVYKSRK